MALKAIPRSLFSWKFTLLEGPREIAVLDARWLREGIELFLEGKPYAFVRTGEAFELRSGGETLARARMTDLRRRAFEVTHGGRCWTLRADGFMTRRFKLWEGDRCIDTIAPRGPFTKKTDVDVDASIPLAVQAFLFWVVVAEWKRFVQEFV